MAILLEPGMVHTHTRARARTHTYSTYTYLQQIGVPCLFYAFAAGYLGCGADCKDFRNRDRDLGIDARCGILWGRSFMINSLQSHISGGDCVSQSVLTILRQLQRYRQRHQRVEHRARAPQTSMTSLGLFCLCLSGITPLPNRLPPPYSSHDPSA
jgi:hypothetical protein